MWVRGASRFSGMVYSRGSPNSRARAGLRGFVYCDSCIFFVRAYAYLALQPECRLKNVFGTDATKDLTASMPSTWSCRALHFG